MAPRPATFCSQGLDPSVGYVTAYGSAPGEGVVYRNKLSPHELVKAPTDGEYHNIYHLFSRGGLRMRPTAPCFGSRVRDDGSISTYQWQTYQEVDKRVGAFAAALVKLDLAPTTADGKRFLGFFLKNSRDWMVGALACYRIGVVVVPMYDTLGPETVSYIQGQTMMSTALCTAAELKLLTKQKTFPFANVLVSGALSKEVRAAAEAKGVRVFTVAELEALGQPNLGLLASVPEPKPADLAYLCYTSGTTGDPKGAMLSHGNLLAAIGNAGFPSLSIFAMDPNGPQEVHLSYLPLAHVFETVVMNFCLYRGAAVGFYQGDTLKILEDLQVRTCLGLPRDDCLVMALGWLSDGPLIVTDRSGSSRIRRRSVPLSLSPSRGCTTASTTRSSAVLRPREASRATSSPKDLRRSLSVCTALAPSSTAYGIRSSSRRFASSWASIGAPKCSAARPR